MMISTSTTTTSAWWAQTDLSHFMRFTNPTTALDGCCCLCIGRRRRMLVDSLTSVMCVVWGAILADQTARVGQWHGFVWIMLAQLTIEFLKDTKELIFLQKKKFRNFANIEKPVYCFYDENSYLNLKLSLLKSFVSPEFLHCGNHKKVYFLILQVQGFPSHFNELYFYL